VRRQVRKRSARGQDGHHHAGDEQDGCGCGEGEGGGIDEGLAGRVGERLASRPETFELLSAAWTKMMEERVRSPISGDSPFSAPASPLRYPLLGTVPRTAMLRALPNSRDVSLTAEPTPCF